ncbi:hypothetical protein C8A00DRAFT_39280 [Chaetomidium leptoderma]|uniref:Arylamine N-acetyltransferase n=1 Tax=Chaetomidium leptoderma TaxID=669021 RepID=A0AAN6VWB2_9PEZI|nr:hypothetical protein C8A00DRAFT_39280 [Chaetomidium leptoderma]
MDSAYTPSPSGRVPRVHRPPPILPPFHPPSKPTLDLTYLTTLFTHQLTAIPYDNLSIHYSPQHAITLDPQALATRNTGWVHLVNIVTVVPNSSPLVVYQVRNGESEEKAWVPFFLRSMTSLSFTEQDFGNINWYMSQSSDSHQTWTPLAIRFLRGAAAGEDGGGVKVVGKVTMVKGVVKRNLTGKTELVKALRELFGICLTEEEAASIRGRQAELVGEVA